jgi:hypothetical protein
MIPKKQEKVYQTYIETLYATFDEPKALDKAGITPESLAHALNLDSELKAARDTFFENFEELLRQKVRLLGASYLVKVLSVGVTKTQNQRTVKVDADGYETTTESFTVSHEPPPTDLVKFALTQALSKSESSDADSGDSLLEASIDLLLNS